MQTIEKENGVHKVLYEVLRRLQVCWLCLLPQQENNIRRPIVPLDQLIYIYMCYIMYFIIFLKINFYNVFYNKNIKLNF